MVTKPIFVKKIEVNSTNKESFYANICNLFIKAIMNTKIILIIGFSYLYAFFELFMGLRQKRERKVKTTGDKGSIWVLGIMITIGYSLSFAIGSTKAGRISPWNTFFIIGFVLIAFGLFIRIKSLLTLKQHFTYTVTKIEDHELIETGLYKTIRHPGYLGQIIIFIGISTTLSNWLSAVLMLLPVLIGYLYRIKVEEKFMIAQFGEKYIHYQIRTKRLVPLLY
jgi:protein-S-isoprenylcysteine O-methyltransferase Ste14